MSLRVWEGVSGRASQVWVEKTWSSCGSGHAAIVIRDRRIGVGRLLDGDNVVQADFVVTKVACCGVITTEGCAARVISSTWFCRFERVQEPHSPCLQNGSRKSVTIMSLVTATGGSPKGLLLPPYQVMRAIIVSHRL